MSTVTAQDRCVAHPGRPAVDRCPRCDRLRCGADALGQGCAICTRAPGAAVRPLPPDSERLVRAALVANLVALVAGPIASEYVASPWAIRFLAPVVIGMAVVMAATAAAKHPRRGRLLQQVRLMSVVYSLVAMGIGFVIEGTYDLFSGSPNVLVPYALAGLSAWVASSPPRQRPAKASSAE